jgi:hypothetical protein
MNTTETLTEYRHESWIREFDELAIIALVDNCMADYPFPQKGIADTSFVLRMELDGLFRRTLTAEQRIEWASKIDWRNIIDFDDYCERENEADQDAEADED